MAKPKDEDAVEVVSEPQVDEAPAPAGEDDPTEDHEPVVRSRKAKASDVQVRRSANSWWCPECDTASPSDVTSCPKCGFAL
jgi:predicted RNA-binding Zn-ribbon protein involved in translation (DUF1610 family)